MTLAEAVSALPPRTPILGLDLGTKTIGIAISDLTRRIASPFHTIRRRKFTQDARELLDIAVRENARLFVIGLPLNMDGSEG
ncbi:MAG: Holliday junction resolvase RuvX, partial [Hyphomicrobiales bacterium]